MICMSLYCGPQSEFKLSKKNQQSQKSGDVIWVDTMEQHSEQILKIFADQIFANPDIKKVFHNYSFDRHVLDSAIRKLGPKYSEHKLRGFYADTMHMARLLDTDRQSYSLADLQEYWQDQGQSGSAISRQKVPIKQLFEVPKGTKILPTEEYQSDPSTREKWIQYSALDAEATWQLFSALKNQLQQRPWRVEEDVRKCLGVRSNSSLWDFYEQLYRPFGQLLTEIEARGITVNAEYLKIQQEKAEIEIAMLERIFRQWVAKRVPEAINMNVNSNDQRRQLFFGGQGYVPVERTFSIENPEYIRWKEHPKEEKTSKGKAPKRKIDMTLTHLWAKNGMDHSPLEPLGNSTNMQQLPQVGQEVLEVLAGNREAVLQALHILDPFNTFLILKNQKINFQKFEEPESLESRFFEICKFANKKDLMLDYGLDEFNVETIKDFTLENLRSLLEETISKQQKRNSHKKNDVESEERSETLSTCLEICRHLQLREKLRSDKRWQSLMKIKDISSVEGSKRVNLMTWYQFGRLFMHFSNIVEGLEACLAAKCLVNYTSIMKLSSTYLQPLQNDDIRGSDGRVHCQLNVNTDTGRLSSRNPNLQNQPAYDKDARYQVRQAFVAGKGNKFVIADYGQLELRVLAHISDCASMQEEFKIGGDLHSRTAYKMFSDVKKLVDAGQCLIEHPGGKHTNSQQTIKEAFPQERQQAKTLNFSIVYGKTAKGLAEEWNYSVARAKQLLNMWFEARPEVQTWQKAQITSANENGYVLTMLGRQRDLKVLKGKSLKTRSKMVQELQRKAINSPVQGSGADIVMLAMLRLEQHPLLQELGWRLVLQIHDEVILEGPEDSAEQAQEIIVECMQNPFWNEEGQKYCNPLKVALMVDSRICDNWYKER
eukprot:TRINITY_DN12485_c0_g1_i3.p1 TRINITY_DN12485_c0_g1~~TRINITY_DN12485_c0_g1_i3.p1  ORF type:complete len:997 (-),score=105.38 TRINITY_DN12485_c0_g1_i3:526-3174(-)